MDNFSATVPLLDRSWLLECQIQEVQPVYKKNYLQYLNTTGNDQLLVIRVVMSYKHGHQGSSTVIIHWYCEGPPEWCRTELSSPSSTSTWIPLWSWSSNPTMPQWLGLLGCVETWGSFVSLVAFAMNNFYQYCTRTQDCIFSASLVSKPSWLLGLYLLSNHKICIFLLNKVV